MKRATREYNRTYSRNWYLGRKARDQNRQALCPYCEEWIDGELGAHLQEHELADPEFFAEVDGWLRKKT